jgi:hypothetical protein
MATQTVISQALDFWNNYGKELITGGGTVVGALLGAGFAVFAVSRTNRTNQANLKLQLENDRNLKKDAYELETKRSVYMDVATAIQLELNLIDNLGDLEKTHSDLYEPFKNVQGALAKMHLIAGAESLKSLISVHTEVTASVFSLCAERNRLLEVHHAAQQIRRDINDQVALQKNYISMYAASDVDGLLDGKRHDAITKAIGSYKSTIESLQQSLAQTLDGHQPARQAFALECSGARLRIEKLLPPLVIAVRRELKIEIDAEEYASLMASARDSQFQLLKNAMNPGA